MPISPVPRASEDAPAPLPALPVRDAVAAAALFARAAAGVSALAYAATGGPWRLEHHNANAGPPDTSTGPRLRKGPHRAVEVQPHELADAQWSVAASPALGHELASLLATAASHAGAGAIDTRLLPLARTVVDQIAAAGLDVALARTAGDRS